MDNVTRLLMQGAAGAAGGGLYVDEVFSTNVYGPDSNAQGARTITTNIDYNEGALIWTKSRGSTRQHMLVDTVRGVSKQIHSDSHIAESTASTPSWAINTLTETGYNIGTGSDYRDANYFGNNEKYASWNFRKAKGFFDIVTWTGNATNSSSPPRQIAHNLGSVPGAIWVKCLTANQSWACYHTSLGATRYMHLSDNGAGGTSVAWWNNTEPTSTHFTVGYDGQVNENNQQYVAYVFAGGESTADDARSVDFDGSDDYLALGNSSDLSPEGGDFTWEAWIKPDSWTTGNWDAIYVNTVVDGFYVGHTNANVFVVRAYYTANYIETSNLPPLGQWTHVAVTRSGSTLRLFFNGILEKSVTNSTSFATGNTKIANDEYGSTFDGNISNLRFVKGTAVYTTSFRPPTEPLTNITNTKLLCCNNSSITGSTVAPATITSGGGPTASTDSPFDDPEGFKFGEGGDQNIVNCGSYIGNQHADGPEVHLGWEPQWIIIKPTSGSENWGMWDSIRGIVTGGNDMRLLPNTTHAEIDNFDGLTLTPTGFKITSANHLINPNGTGVVYIAIRRPDGLVGKPPEAGTDAFAMDTGAGSSTIPNFDSGFPVDFAFYKNPGSGGNWITGSRLTSGKYLHVNNTDTESSSNVMYYDSNVGWNKDSSGNSSWQSWMWKRGQGFDVVNYVGNQTSGHQIPHSLGQPPEMIWTKNRDQIQQWSVGHKGLNGGTNPWNWVLVLSDAEAEQESTNFWEAPTATHFTVDSDARVNKNNLNYLAILFSSVEGISKVGSYTGSSSALTITTGFQPRFVIIKNVVDTGYNWTTGWFTFDTTRGWAAGNNDKRMRLNDTAAQTTEDWTNPISTGFTINANSGNHLNHNGERYIYYAHA